jgi:hypothetical protein
MLTEFYDVENVYIKDNVVGYNNVSTGNISKKTAEKIMQDWFNYCIEPIDCKLFRRRAYINTDTPDLKIYETFEIYNDGEVRRYINVLRIVEVKYVTDNSLG